MAKVSGPLFSLTASGTIAKAMVHFQHKGQGVVRQWIIPKNKKSPDQGDQRTVLGGVGRACGAVKVTSTYNGQLTTLKLVKGVQTKQSYLVKEIISRFCSDVTAYEAVAAEYAAHTAKSSFDSNAATIGLYDFSIMYSGTTVVFAAGLQLYLLAKVAIALQFTGTPFSVALASWSGTNVTALVASIAAAQL